MPLFPPSERVIYQRNPISNAVCELRYPQLLRIATEVPAAFQERIRRTFENYERVSNPVISQMPAELFQAMGLPPSGVTHKFVSEDGYTLSVGAGSISLSTANYTEWGRFFPKLEEGFSALVEEYQPSAITRIGLRYQNIIDRQKLGISDWPWRDLVRPELAGELAIEDWASSAVEAMSVIRCPINGDQDFVRLQHGLATLENSSELAYALDFDYYTDVRTEIRNALDVVSRLHTVSGPAFRWSISDRLHEEMAPRSA